MSCGDRNADEMCDRDLTTDLECMASWRGQTAAHKARRSVAVGCRAVLEVVADLAMWQAK